MWRLLQSPRVVSFTCIGKSWQLLRVEFGVLIPRVGQNIGAYRGVTAPGGSWSLELVWNLTRAPGCSSTPVEQDRHPSKVGSSVVELLQQPTYHGFSPLCLYNTTPAHCRTSPGLQLHPQNLFSGFLQSSVLIFMNVLKNLVTMGSSQESFIGSIDQGTTSSRFLIFNKSGEPVASHQLEFKQIYPHPG